MMTRTDISNALAPHLRRPIRAFLADKAVQDSEAEAAFWEAIYANTTCTTHADAARLAAKLDMSPERVERVLEGWKP